MTKLIIFIPTLTLIIYSIKPPTYRKTILIK